MLHRVLIAPVLCLMLPGASALAGSLDGRAAEILKATGVKGGLIVHVGCGDGRLTAELGAGESFLVHGLETQAEDVAKAREHIRSQGLYGKVSVDRFDGKRLPYVDGLVNLLVCSDLADVPMAEVMRVLAPLGVAYIESNGAWTKTVKPWPEAIDQWTHFLHGADNNAVARDRVVGPPAQVQWTAGPRWSRGHDVTPSVFAPVSAGGRLFYVLDEGPLCVIDKRLPEKHALVARDAFNGVVLWRRPIADWYSSRVIWGHIPIHSQRRLVAAKDCVYATLGLQAPVTALDAATGAVIREYEGTERTSEIVCDSGTLALVIRDEQPLDGLLAGRDGKRFRQAYAGPKGGGEALMAVRADTGECLWRAQRHCLPLTLAVSGRRVFFAEHENVVCLDLDSGQEIWSQPCPARTLVVHDGVVLTAPGRSVPARTIEVTALAADDGHPLWTAKGDCLPSFHLFFSPIDLFVVRGLLWGLAENLEWNDKPGSGNLLGLDLASGEVRARIPLAGSFTPGHHVRCYKGKATERFLLFNKRGIEFLDIASEGAAQQYRWIRGACRYGILPCNGLVYAPSHACACYPGAKLDGFYALAPASAESKGRSDRRPRVPKPGIEEDNRLERGPAYAAHVGQQSKVADPGDWPTYRHDGRRSGSTLATVAPNLKLAWQNQLGGKLSAPVVADGRVFVAGVDCHAVYCLDAKHGQTLWQYTAGARIDSPPTVSRGRVLFGCRDGWVYCVRASDGALAWRFRAAPLERSVGAFGQLESAWPVHGSVLVEDGTVYFAAGRSSFLEGGIRLFGLDVASGDVRYETTLGKPGPPASEGTISATRMPGAVPDILSGDGPYVYMRHVRLNRDLSDRLDAAALSWGVKDESHLLAGSGFLDDSLFSRTVWKYGIRVDRSQMLVLDGKTVYGLRVYSGISWNSPVFNVGDGYLLFRQDVSKPVPRPPRQKQRIPGRIPYERYLWHTRVPVRVCAMVLTGGSPGGGATADAPSGASRKTLFVAGSPDEIDPNEPLAAFEGKKGGRLLVLSADDGQTLAEHPLNSPPVWDGMAATSDRLYLATLDGKVLCMSSGAPKPRSSSGD